MVFRVGVRRLGAVAANQLLPGTGICRVSWADPVLATDAEGWRSEHAPGMRRLGWVGSGVEAGDLPRPGRGALARACVRACVRARGCEPEAQRDAHPRARARRGAGSARVRPAAAHERDKRPTPQSRAGGARTLARTG